MNRIALILIPIGFLLGIMHPFIQYDPSGFPVEQLNAVLLDSREIFGGPGFRQSILQIFADTLREQRWGAFFIVAVFLLVLPILRYLFALWIYANGRNTPGHKSQQALGGLLVSDLGIVGLIVFSVWSSHLLIELFSIGSLAYLTSIAGNWYLALAPLHDRDVV